MSWRSWVRAMNWYSDGDIYIMVQFPNLQSTGINGQRPVRLIIHNQCDWEGFIQRGWLSRNRSGSAVNTVKLEKWLDVGGIPSTNPVWPRSADRPPGGTTGSEPLMPLAVLKMQSGPTPPHRCLPLCCIMGIRSLERLAGSELKDTGMIQVPA